MICPHCGKETRNKFGDVKFFCVKCKVEIAKGEYCRACFKVHRKEYLSNYYKTRIQHVEKGSGV